jgi:putative FmdB family regulatory protein
MPTYEYICRACGHTFEIVQSMKDASLTECPECGGELRKVFAPPVITFRGSGFYATDHRRKSEGSKDKEPADAASSKKGGDGKDSSSTPGTESTSSSNKGSPDTTTSKSEGPPSGGDRSSGKGPPPKKDEPS